ncbi:hypothetical protein [Secundilactobacillus malefermentans]|uniref:YolD-like protein n=1 Tax=Secundilactobacillus malefermentans TaxID=176292 RepID=A0A4V3A416_9LACO|nr:hypothetical protein [Secundilactobacillus malefermentans]KRM57937.1 hypothetical protein FD44_GL000915 [Secundilactobacillus malefermentans DSM 5705 = KCTC 3548]QEA31186.1 hypothetical protein FGL90_02820 [Secundilactobacillus malefermentans]TDG78463.1 hypothetical protein C5L31_001079 [Secundilactobacillus malefermentans]
MKNMLENAELTAIEAYQNNQVIEVDYQENAVTAKLTGLVNFVSDHDYFYLTRHGKVTQIHFQDVLNIDILHKKWWQLQLQTV